MPFRVGPQTRQTGQMEPHRRINAVVDEGLAMPSLPYALSPTQPPKSTLTNIQENHQVGTTPSPTQGSSETLTSHPLQTTSDSPPVSDARPSVITCNSDSSSGSTTAFSPSVTSLSNPLRRDSTTTPHSPPTFPIPLAAPGRPTAAGHSGMKNGRVPLGPLVFAGGPLSVLVVEDDNLTRRLMARMMDRLGCSVATAENGQIALDLILDDSSGTLQANGVKNYDIVFLDNQVRLLFFVFGRVILPAQPLTVFFPLIFTDACLFWARSRQEIERIRQR